MATKVKSLMVELNIRIQRTEERISELDDKTIEITQSEQRKIDWKKFKYNRVPRTSETTTKYLTFV